MKNDLAIRNLGEADLSQFRALRLEALQENPAAFGGDYDEESRLSDGYFAGLLSESLWFGVWHNERLLGTAALRIAKPAKMRHRAEIWGMYLQSALRGSGLADRLISTLVDSAHRQNVEQIELHVMKPNAKARRFYERHGFREIGHTPHAVKMMDGSYRDDFTLMRFLNGQPVID